MALEEYRQKRSFENTPEPLGDSKPNSENQWRFVVQKHAASRLHYDLRLELDGVLLSWAIPKGPSLDWSQKRLAIHVEDHPLEYLEFEGVIPQYEYGGGTVMVWDLGHWRPRDNAVVDYAAGALKFDLQGKKLRGGWMLKRLDNRGENQWLLLKEKDSAMRELDDFDVLTELPNSVLTERDLDEIAADKDAIWSSTPTVKASYVFPCEEYPEAIRAPMPAQIKPCLPTSSRQPPTGEQWVHEIKYDGYRMLSRLENGEARFYSRSGKDWTNKLKTLAQSITQLPVESALIDGEVVMMNADGVSSFQDLQNHIGAGRDTKLRYYAFDLLHLNDYQLTGLSLLERKKILAELLQSSGVPERLVFSEHLKGHGPTIFRQACKLGVEGIVSKRSDKRYAQGRFEFWQKTKCMVSREFLIGGFTPPTSSRKGLGAILLGVPSENKKLHFVGKVGTGFTHETLVHLRARLDQLKISKSPFGNLDRRTADKGTMWVKPKLIAEIEFGGWTGAGLIRFGSFRGLRDDAQIDDLDLRLPSLESATETNSSSTEPAATIGIPSDVRVESTLELPAELATVKLSSPDRLVYPDMGITKLGVATYYAQVGRWMLPEIVGRPVSLLRCPGGVADTCFFQKRAPQGLHDSVERIELPTTEGNRMFMVIHDLVGLLALVQFGVLEFHVSGARADKFERPDRLVFDLDPDEKLSWSNTTRAAIEIRDWLAGVGLSSFLKTTGGKGLHIVVPIRRRHTWDDVKNFARQVAAMFEGRSPRRFTTNPSKNARRGKIYVDALRNARGATCVAAYSTRANLKALVSVPIDWNELESMTSSDSMSLQAVISRLAQQGSDPWKELNDVQQSITKQAWKELV